jgi:AraC-like DNA-binding protein
MATFSGYFRTHERRPPPDQHGGGNHNVIRVHGISRQSARDQALAAFEPSDLTPVSIGPAREGVESGRHTTLGAGACGTISHVTVPPAGEQHLRDLVWLRRVRDRIDREYAQPLDVEALARGAHMSAGHFSREFRSAYGESPYAYLMTRRIERAMALLRRGDLSVTDVCFAVGCSSLGTFSSRFTQLVGMPPSTYRRRAAGATDGMPSCVAKQVTRPIRNREASVTGPQLA